MTRYFDRPTPAVKRVKRQEVQRRYRERHREALLQNKKEYARRADTLARRRHLYRHRNDPKPAAPPPPIPVTLDMRARRDSGKASLTLHTRPLA